ncbi:hypothetical protein HYPSUDRAFT_201593 [Hypholoma sublateritium FD-334 SS-4]|uniref:Uncharacterized protein n=1 Tax=Hypholoma sublateritium (strain FD-334 SS-4) TaxID=945553 RepID=A0A0D2NWY8_HYPSF|nr:hypothetical protein HYPSUDRAFT_201593 [Hypholoma sublateritium FD-334 SS-4]
MYQEVHHTSVTCTSSRSANINIRQTPLRCHLYRNSCACHFLHAAQRHLLLHVEAPAPAPAHRNTPSAKRLCGDAFVLIFKCTPFPRRLTPMFLLYCYTHADLFQLSSTLASESCRIRFIKEERMRWDMYSARVGSRERLVESTKFMQTVKSRKKYTRIAHAVRHMGTRWTCTATSYVITVGSFVTGPSASGATYSLLWCPPHGSQAKAKLRAGSARFPLAKRLYGTELKGGARRSPVRPRSRGATGKGRAPACRDAAIARRAACAGRAPREGKRRRGRFGQRRCPAWR